MNKAERKEVNRFVNSFDLSFLELKKKILEKVYEQRIRKELDRIISGDFSNIRYFKYYSGNVIVDKQKKALIFLEGNGGSNELKKLLNNGYVISSHEFNKNGSVFINLVKREPNIENYKKITQEDINIIVFKEVKKAMDKYVKKVSKELYEQDKIAGLYFDSTIENPCFYASIVKGEISLYNKLKAHFDQKSNYC
jgi:hypothetical protein